MSEDNKATPISSVREQLRNRIRVKFRNLTFTLSKLAELADEYDAAIMQSLVYRSRNSENAVDVAAAALVEFLDREVAE